ncbi:hypothetical protein PENDEC_c042G05445 [Penicillium decumbens]|uniref:DUF202 domain-containing protein n=1 Tax=Penicillium decumbens TaxID=69771 RepID=A0A1V6NR20_PENDC|nr:hypothetical protein PENDEC_c042G05445 [Penicillium decumbens]
MASSLRRIIPSRVANTGSQQRDHAANERTFLSWTRAGLGFAAMALALDRLDAIDRLLTSRLGNALTSPQHAGVPSSHEARPVATDAKHSDPNSRLQTIDMLITLETDIV